jgi:hypothetical protein
MKTILYYICVLILLAGCDSADKPAVSGPASGTKPAAVESRDSLTGEREASADTAAGVTVESALVKAGIRVDEKGVTVDAKLAEEAESGNSAAVIESGKEGTVILSTDDNKKFRRFDPDPEEVARKTAVEKVEKGPALTSVYRKIIQPAE